MKEQLRRLLRCRLLSVCCVLAVGLLVPAEVHAQGNLTTVAGTLGTAGFSGDGGPATSATLSSQAYGVAFDAAGNVYIADTLNQRIRKVTKSNGVITTIAGTGVVGFSGDGGPAINATFHNPLSVAVDSTGILYVSDSQNDRIRMIDTSGIIRTYAGSAPIGANFDGDGVKAATLAHMTNPFGLAVDASDNLYVADTGNHRIRKITKSTGQISTVAGSGGPSGGTGGGNGGFSGDGGAATAALLSYPSFIAVDSALNLYIADDCNQRIRKVTASTAKISTLAGSTTIGCKTSPVVDYSGDGGPATSAHLSHPYGVAVDTGGNVFIADYYNFVIRKVTPAGTISTFAGIGGQSGMSPDNLPANSAHLADPVGVAVDAAGVVYIVDQSSFRIRKVTPAAAVTPPGVPAGLTVTQNGPNSAQISWNAVPGATNYLLKLSLTPGGPKNIVTNTTTTLVGVPGLTQGQTYYFVVSANNSGGESANSAEVLFIIPKAVSRPSDLDGDSKADVVIWRPTDGTYYWLTSSSGYSYAAQRNKPWGNQGQGDVPFTGDIDGDGAADLIIWRAATGTWFWLTSSSGYNYAAQGTKAWGNQGLGDIPMLGDMDGDGKVDLVVWRASTGTFYWLTSSSGFTGQGQARWGNQSLGDKPFLADFDGDGKTDPVVWRASTGVWFWLKSTSGYTAQGQAQWGSQAQSDVPMVGDMDGDGKSEVIVWRPGTGTWFWLTSASGYTQQVNATWGRQSLGDVPLLSDFDGDGRMDLTVWRASTGTWYWLTSSSGFAGGVSVQWGSQSLGDKPIVK